MQTNGTLLDEEWCEFLKTNRFLVGLSIDGPREIHDHYRVTKGGRPTFDKVFAAAKLLQRYGVPFNTLTCVNRFNGRRPLDVYRFLRQELNSTYIQFIPIVEHKTFDRTAPQTWNNAELPKDGDPEARPGHPNSIVKEWSVDPEDWGYFLCRVFDRWLNQDIGKVMVNHFETLVAQHHGASFSNVRLQRNVRKRRGHGKRRQCLFLRPLRLSRNTGWETSKTGRLGRHGLFPRLR